MQRPAPNRISERIASKAVDEAFVQCPDAFLRELTPEQYRSRQQLYHTALEQAKRASTEPKPFVPPFEFEFQDGI